MSFIKKCLPVVAVMSALAIPSTGIAFADPSTTPSSPSSPSTSAAPQSGKGEEKYVKWRDEVDKIVKAAGSPSAYSVAAPGRGVNVYKEIKECEGLDKDKCSEKVGDKGNTVKNAGNFYEDKSEKIAAVAYELALAKQTSKSPAKKGSKNAGVFFGEGGKERVYKTKDGVNPREQASNDFKRLFDNLENKEEIWTKFNKVRFGDSETTLNIWPLSSAGGTPINDKKPEKADEPTSYLQQAATIVITEGKFDRYKALVKLAETPVETPSDDAPVSGQEKTTDKVDTDKLKTASGKPLTKSKKFVDLQRRITIKGDEWNIRDAAGLSGKVVGKSDNGTKLAVIGTASDVPNADGSDGVFKSPYTWPDEDNKVHKDEVWIQIVIPDSDKVGYIAYPTQN